jgi:CubicO group peptidase (beta-lactamase class C family)
MRLLIIIATVVISASGYTQDHFTMTKKQVEQLMKENKIQTIGIGIIKNGTVQKVGVYGKLCNRKKAPRSTIFNVASLTKPIVAVLTLRLVNAGAWSLDEPLSTYWTDPDLTDDPRAQNLTTRRLLSHQGGFPNWRWMDSSKKLSFHFDPGTKFQYSGEGYEYLRRALEHKFHLPLEQLADSFLLKPLGMNATSFLSVAPSAATAFCKDADQPSSNKKVANAADDLLTTVEDYATFAKAVLNRQGLSETLNLDMMSPQVKIKDGDYMGLGWELLPNLKDNEFALLHTGSDKDATTLVILLPKTQEGLILFTNSSEGFKLYPTFITNCLSLGKEIMGRAK